MLVRALDRQELNLELITWVLQHNPLKLKKDVTLSLLIPIFYVLKAFRQPRVFGFDLPQVPLELRVVLLHCLLRF